MAIKLDPMMLAAFFEAQAREQGAAAQKAAQAAAHHAVRDLKVDSPVDTGHFKSAWEVIQGPPHTPAIVANTVPYAGVIEGGRRPGKPVSEEGRQALALWASRKLGITDPEELAKCVNGIVFKYIKHGHPGLFLVKKNLKTFGDYWRDELIEEIKKAAKVTK